MATIAIPTVQNVVIDYPLASLGERILAFFIDLLCLFGLILLLALIERLTPFIAFSEISIIAYVLYLFFWLYHLLFEIFFNGQSLGKKAMKLKVVSKDGTSPSFSSFFMRWIFRLLEITLFQGSLAAIVIAINGKGQRLGDLAAGTTVISLKTAASRKALNLPRRRDRNMEYNEVTRLSDAQMAKIREIYASARRHGNKKLMVDLAKKIEQMIDVKNREQSAHSFVKKIMEDYTVYFEKE